MTLKNVSVMALGLVVARAAGRRAGGAALGAARLPRGHGRRRAGAAVVDRVPARRRRARHRASRAACASSANGKLLPQAGGGRAAGGLRRARAACSRWRSIPTSPEPVRSTSPTRSQGRRQRDHDGAGARHASRTIGSTDVQQLFESVSTGRGHFGGKIAFDGNGYLFLTLGDRQVPPEGNLEAHPAQDLSNHHGKIIRLHDDGRVPADNPFVKPRRRQARDLELRPPQHPGPRHPSRRPATSGRTSTARRAATS